MVLKSGEQQHIAGIITERGKDHHNISLMFARKSKSRVKSQCSWYLGFPASTTNKNRVIKAQRDHHYVFNAQIWTRTINIQKFNHSKEFYIIFLTLRPVDLLMVEPIRLPEEDHWARKIT